MSPHPLDNPMWSSLVSRHRQVALGKGDVLRYPSIIAPFVGLRTPASVDIVALDALVEPNETVFFVGDRPALGPGWQLNDLSPLVQMVCPKPVPEVLGPTVVTLDRSHRPAVLALTALVYPHYFRERTMDLGRYFGIFEDGRLAAMAGERMGMPGFREISAVCTHPDFLGRGYARRLLVSLANDILSGGEVPFLHVSGSNERALRLYEQNGFHARVQPPFWSLRRKGDTFPA